MEPGSSEKAVAAEEAADLAEAAGDRSGTMLARALALYLRTAVGELDTTDEQAALLHEALPLEEDRADPRRLAVLWELRRQIANFRMRNEECLVAAEHALRYHHLAGDSPADSEVEFVLVIGPRPADEALRRVAELAASRPPGATDQPRAVLLAMLGRFDEAWPLAEAASDHLREIGGPSLQDVHLYLGLIATIEGDRERACRHHVEMIDGGLSGSVGALFRALVARDLCYLGRHNEAEPLLREAQTVPPRTSMRVVGPSVESLLLAERGQLEKAEYHARLAVEAAETGTDAPFFQAWASEDLATVLERAGRIGDARGALEHTLAIWERKGCIPCAERTREWIDSLST
jgi:tetratricopeptide (TPR) repeat protein